MAQAAPVGSLLPGKAEVAIDGTTLHLPRSGSLVRSFPITLDALELETHHYPQARLVSAWDVEWRVPLAWRLTSQRIGEDDSLAIAKVVRDGCFTAVRLPDAQMGTLMRLTRHRPSPVGGGALLQPEEAADHAAGPGLP